MTSRPRTSTTARFGRPSGLNVLSAYQATARPPNPSRAARSSRAEADVRDRRTRDGHQPLLPVPAGNTGWTSAGSARTTTYSATPWSIRRQYGGSVPVTSAESTVRGAVIVYRVPWTVEHPRGRRPPGCGASRRLARRRAGWRSRRAPVARRPGWRSSARIGGRRAPAGPRTSAGARPGAASAGSAVRLLNRRIASVNAERRAVCHRLPAAAAGYSGTPRSATHGPPAVLVSLRQTIVAGSLAVPGEPDPHRWVAGRLEHEPVGRSDHLGVAVAPRRARIRRARIPPATQCSCQVSTWVPSSRYCSWR